MRGIPYTLTVLCFFAILGCSAVGVPYTSDPAKKLWYAQNLVSELDRPLPAENLIKESYELCHTKYPQDETCLATVYVTYAQFLESDAVRSWSGWYQKNGFWDKSVTVDNRFEKAIEYWHKAIRTFEKEGMLVEVSYGQSNIDRIRKWYGVSQK